MSKIFDIESLAKKRLRLVKGVPITMHFKEEFIDDILECEPRQGDVIIASYPKTGTTWISYIVQQILTKGASFPNTDEMMNKAIPFMEMTGRAAVDALTTNPRVYKHHLPYHIIKKNLNAKFIYIYRRPEDTFVSYYHFLRNHDDSLDFDQYFEDFIAGEVSYGSYFDHILSFLEHQHDANLLLISYETLHVNTKEEILKIAKFLGDDYYNNLLDDEVLSKIVKQTSFDYMKENLIKKATEIQDPASRDVAQFFRKGIVGDGKNSLKSDQLERLRKLTEEKMKGTKVYLEWA